MGQKNSKEESQIGQQSNQVAVKVSLVDRACRGPIVDKVFVAGPNDHVWYRSPDALYYDANGRLLWEFSCPALSPAGNCNRVAGSLYPCPMNTPSLRTQANK